MKKKNLKRSIMKTIKFKLTAVLIPLFLMMIALGGCKDSVVAPDTSENVDLSVMSNQTTDSRGDVLILTEAKVLIKDIKLNVANTSENTSNFKTGPFLLYLDLTSTVTLMTSAYIPPGSYDKVRFEIHKLQPNEPLPDPDFEDVNGRYSVIVKGNFNGVDFIFKSDVSAHQKITFPGWLEVSAGRKTNITLQVTPVMWFLKNGLILDPTNIANRNDIDINIRENINANIKAFKDENRDGQPD